MKQGTRYIRWLEEIKIGDIPIVGGKNASLGEMYRELTSQGVKIPNGFAVTAESYWYLLETAGILDELKDAMVDLDKTNLADLIKRGKVARDLILGTGIPDNLWTEIRTAYDRLCKECGPDTDVAVPINSLTSTPIAEPPIVLPGVTSVSHPCKPVNSV